MIKLQVNVTFSQLQLISEILTPGQLEQIDEVLKPQHTGTTAGFPIPKHLQAMTSTEDAETSNEEAVESHKQAVCIAPVDGVAVRKKGGVKGPKMAAFGRTTEQMAVYEAAEEARTEAVDEEEELKRQRAEERAARKAEKDREEADKKADEKKAADEVAAIKAMEEENNEVKDVKLPLKPWEVIK